MNEIVRWEELLCGSDAELSLLRTDLAEPESLLQTMAHTAQAREPERFAGKSPCVYMRLRYTPPCENFRELRRLILRQKEAAGLRADFRGIVAMDVTEWLGHEKEEYFTVVLKYLSDHSRHSHPVMVLTAGSDSQVRRFAAACAVYLLPEVLDARIFTDSRRLQALVEQTFAAHGSTLEPAGLDALVQAMGSKELAHARSLQLPDRVAARLTRKARGGVVTEAQVRRELEDEGSVLVMLAGRALPAGKERYDKDTLQL